MEQVKKCPYFGEEILADAKKCKHCGEWLEVSEQPARVQTPYKQEIGEEEGFFAHHVLKNCKPLFQFSGKLGRKDYWIGSLVLYLVFLGISLSLFFLCTGGFLSGAMVKGAFAVIGILGVLLTIVALGMAVRRLHDIGKSGWLVLLSYIPIANFYLLYLLCKRGVAESGATTHKPIDYACWAAILLCPFSSIFLASRAKKRPLMN